jgi:hypothetical protein
MSDHPPRLVVLRGSGDVERIEELAQRALRLARIAEQEAERPGITVGQYSDLKDRARRGRAEFARLQEALERYPKSTPSNPVVVDLNAEASA